MAPVATVIIATYNWSSVLPYSIGSVLCQTFSDFELLVVGDGCTDDSGQVVAAIDDPRVRWINLPANTRHQSGPNNEGLRQARGEIVAYLGHDDLWLPHHLGAMVAGLEPSSDLAYSLAITVAPDGSLCPLIPRPESGRFSSPLCMANRKRVTDEIGGWRDYREIAATPDVELWRRAQARGCSFTFVPRLTGIKFPAGWRRGVYATRPCVEQASWLAKIDSTPDLEARLLVNLVTSDQVFDGVSYRDLARNFTRQLTRGVRHRLTLPRMGRSPRPGEWIDAVRRFKGL